MNADKFSKKSNIESCQHKFLHTVKSNEQQRPQTKKLSTNKIIIDCCFDTRCFSSALKKKKKAVPNGPLMTQSE